MESRLVRGGRNILDTYNERQVELEKKLAEIAERKKREVEMQQQLELQEETTVEIRDTLTSVQQEVEVKTRKLKKCYNKYQVLARFHNSLYSAVYVRVAMNNNNNKNIVSLTQLVQLI